MERLFLSISEGYQSFGCGRSFFYELIREGKIETIKLGKRRLVVAESLRDYAASLRKPA